MDGRSLVVPKDKLVEALIHDPYKSIYAILDGRYRYSATNTAFNGRPILPLKKSIPNVSAFRS